MRRVTCSLLCSVMTLAGACATEEKPRAGKSPTAEAAVSGKQTYTVDVDHASPDGKQYQFAAYYPKSLRVRPGDTVVFDNKSTQAIHTVTFGVAADRSNHPAILLPDGNGNPVVFGPCATSEKPAPDMASCPSAGSSPAPGASPAASPTGAASPKPAKLGPYAGTGYYNSGILLHDIPGIPSPPPVEARKFTLELSESIEPGNYHFVCALHGFMDGTLEVVGQDEDRKPAKAVAEAGKQQYEVDAAAAPKLPEPQLKTEGRTATVTAGVSDKVTSVNKFFPPSVKVKAGDTIVWKADGPYEPHTVTFQNPFKTPEEPGAYVPGGVGSGKSFPGGFSHSGLIGPKPFRVDSFSLKFTNKGSYAYTCIIHPGMGGIVEVQ